MQTKELGIKQLLNRDSEFPAHFRPRSEPFPEPRLFRQMLKQQLAVPSRPAAKFSSAGVLCSCLLPEVLWHQRIFEPILLLLLSASARTLPTTWHDIDSVRVIIRELSDFALRYGTINPFECSATTNFA